jgi:alpha-1,6-mannosyltransferase
VQPWYVLWAIIPLATWATRPRFRAAAIAVTLIVGIFGPTANGDRFTLFQIAMATVASTVILLILMALTYRRLPWRVRAEEPADDPSAPPPPPSPKPDAYAESP